VVLIDESGVLLRNYVRRMMLISTDEAISIMNIIHTLMVQLLQQPLRFWFYDLCVKRMLELEFF
jgi:hypothetical protein